MIMGQFKNMKALKGLYNGTAGRIRTCDQLVRSQFAFEQKTPEKISAYSFSPSHSFVTIKKSFSLFISPLASFVGQKFRANNSQIFYIRIARQVNYLQSRFLPDLDNLAIPLRRGDLS